MIRAAAVALALVLAGGCSILQSDDEASGPGAASGGIPAAFPADFPVPPNASIGGSTVDSAAHRSAMTLQVGSPLSTTVQFFGIELVNAGFVVETSSGDSNGWTIVFSRGELRGSLAITAFGDSSQVVATVNSV